MIWQIKMKKEKKEKKDIVSREKKIYKSNLGKKDFVMDSKSFLNWYVW